MSNVRQTEELGAIVTSNAVPSFSADRPLFQVIATFLAATAGLGPVFDSSNPLALRQDFVAAYRGRVRPDLAIDMGQIHTQCASGAITAESAVKMLCCMLANTAYAILEPHNHYSPEFELLRHVRNAASHGNRFNFFPREPKRPAAWAGFRIDHTRLGPANPLQGVECFGASLSPADLLALLCDVERTIPETAA
jgi:hypothetical protein